MSKKKTTEEFIQELRKKRPELNFLDFSEAVYEGNKIRIKIYCRKHNEWFYETPDQLLRTGVVSCPECKKESKNLVISKNYSNGKRRFLEFLKENFKDSQYDIDQYRGSHEKFKITSSDGKEQYKTPAELRTHIKNEERKKSGAYQSKEKEIKRALIEKISNYDKNIDVSEIDYVDYKTPVKLICKKHSNKEIWITPIAINSRIQKGEFLCDDCSHEKEIRDKTAWFTEEWKKRLYPELDFYDLSKVVFSGYRNKITVHCNKHNTTFEINPYHFLINNQTACKECYKEKMSRSRQESEAKEFFNWLEKEYPDIDYTKAVYIDSSTKLLLFCKKHPGREIWMSPWDIKFNQPRLGHDIICPFCREERYGKARSYGENLVFQWFEKHNLLPGLNEQVQINNIDLKYPNLNKDYIQVDFTYRDQSGKLFWIEYNGKQHYASSKDFHQNTESFEKQVIRDWCEERHCESLGITLIVIPYDRYVIERVWEVLDDVILNGNSPRKWYKDVKERDEILKKNNLI